jgi:hypothetical protein
VRQGREREEVSKRDTRSTELNASALTQPDNTMAVDGEPFLAPGLRAWMVRMIKDNNQ